MIRSRRSVLTTVAGLAAAALAAPVLAGDNRGLLRVADVACSGSRASWALRKMVQLGAALDR
jgi:hypothetical protein